MKRNWTDSQLYNAVQGASSIAAISKKLGESYCSYDTIHRVATRIGIVLPLKIPSIINPGDRFGRLQVVCELDRNKYRLIRFECLCDCGNRTIVSSTNLRKGHTKSCGCLQREVVSNIVKKSNKTKIKNKAIEFKHKSGAFIVNPNTDIYKKLFIYKIINLINNKVYIGQTHRTLKKLIQRYYKEVLYSKKRPIIYSMVKYGTGNFSIEIIEEIANEKIINDREKFYIAHYMSMLPHIGYNITEGGEGTSGYRWSPEAIENIRIRMKGRYKGNLNPFFGKKHNKDTINKVIESNKRRKGKSLSEARKEK